MTKNKSKEIDKGAVLAQMEKLHALGFAVHWLHPKSKRPAKSGWTTGERETVESLRSSYVSGQNIGVRLGSASRVGRGFLAVVDVDVRSKSEKHRLEALDAGYRAVRGVTCPQVNSGRGGGSLHLYTVTSAPFKTVTIARSNDEVKCHMPSKNPSKRDIAELTREELGAGIRMSAAWEVALYSEGRQVVLPPSIHPDSGKPYVWREEPVSVGDFPLVVISGADKTSKATATVKGDTRPLFNWECDDGLDIRWEPRVTENVRALIVSGMWKGLKVSDRSAYLMLAGTSMMKAGMSRDEILSVLTDKSTYLGECGYDHAKTERRDVAARWVWEYTIKKVFLNGSISDLFKAAPISEELEIELNGLQLSKQNETLKEMRHWAQDLARTGPNGEGPPKSTLKNVCLILENAVEGAVLFKRDDFAFREVYGCDAPWGTKAGTFIDDPEISKVKMYLSTRFGFEPNTILINEAVSFIAVKNAFDPVREMLDALPKWDGVPRLATWLTDNFEAEGDEEYLNQVFTKWLVAHVMRVYEPGTKFDWMPIFKGAQGIGKSSFGRLLVGESYFLDWLPNLADKDSALSLQGNWSVEMGELASLRKNETEVVKCFVTRTVDKFRPPFGRRLVELPRRCVFFGTTNKDQYLKDETGNRRFKPVKVGALNFDVLKKERAQLFAEALYLYKTGVYSKGHHLELTGAAKRYEKEAQMDAVIEDDSDVMAEQISDYFERLKNDPKINENFDLTKFRISSLLGEGGPLTLWKNDSRNQAMAGLALKKLGFEKRKVKGYPFWSITKRESIVEDFY